ncbi:MAG TPA: hypothetical protein PKK98_09515, partial [Candidatus Aminicenantes bacterium]|nr:hypothetical protein [Candidatus Aminicenantes bacterium]
REGAPLDEKEQPKEAGRRGLTLSRFLAPVAFLNRSSSPFFAGASPLYQPGNAPLRVDLSGEKG